MPNHQHVLITDAGQVRDYTRPPDGGGSGFRFRPKDRGQHSRKLRNDVTQAQQSAEQLAEETGHVIRDICLEVIGEQDLPLKTESLDARPVQLRAAYEIDGVQHATIFVPQGKLSQFVRKIEEYGTETTPPSKKYPNGRPKHEELVAGISEIRFPVLKSFWTDDPRLFPQAEQETIWWEVWIHVGQGEDPDAVFAEFATAIADTQFRLSPHCIRFPERLVFLAFGSPAQWTRVFVPLLDRLAELRRAKDLPTEFLDLGPLDQREYVDDLRGRIVAPNVNAPAVCLLDYGVHTNHPLLRPLIDDADAQAFDPDWPTVAHTRSHGTEMAGVVAFGLELPELLAGNAGCAPPHRLESVRILHDDHPHNRETWGWVTKTSLAKAETQAPRRARVACLPITADDEGRDRGRPSAWSGAIDDHASGRLDEDDTRRLYVVAAGNLVTVGAGGLYEYPNTNTTSGGIEDPAQSWNALTVGAFTNRVDIRSPDFEGHQPVAPRGGLCPSSRTSCTWEGDVCPLKPDIVMEGGNYAKSPDGRIDGCEDLSLLTTSLDATGRLLTYTGDTSAAAAQASRLAAMLMSQYPGLWPETIRGLLVHSATWTEQMKRQVPGEQQSDQRARLRTFGYGVPDLQRARYTMENCVSLVHQGTIQPFKLDRADAKTNQFVLHSLPWPIAVLEDLHDQDVTVRITLSYFIEPSPQQRGWASRFRYQSHGLRFALRGPYENSASFRRRISSQEWEAGAGTRPSTADPIDWVLGKKLQTSGSIHSDWWTASAADVARSGQVAVHPVTGWWKERKHLGQVEKQARYALIVTISTEATNVDLYTPIATQVGLIPEIEV